MHRLVFPLAAAGALTAFSIVTAFAHASLEQAEAAPGSYKAVIGIPHGCDGQATHTVRVEVPEGFIGVKPMPKAGWELAVEKGDYARSYELHGEQVASGTKTVTWSGGNLPDDFYDEFVLSGTLAGVDVGDRLAFKTIQLCESGEVAWTEVAAEGQDPHSLEHPAPTLTVLAASAEESHGSHGGHEGHAGHEQAATITAGDLELSGQWARAMLPSQPSGGGYVTISNKGGEADRLISASSPTSGKVEIHTMSMKDGVMVMRPVSGGLEIPAGQTVELKPGGLHLMFMQVKEPFREGASVPVSLTFEKAGQVELALPVRPASGKDAHSHH